MCDTLQGQHTLLPSALLLVLRLKYPIMFCKHAFYIPIYISSQVAALTSHNLPHPLKTHPVTRAFFLLYFQSQAMAPRKTSTKLPSVDTIMTSSIDMTNVRLAPLASAQNEPRSSYSPRPRTTSPRRGLGSQTDMPGGPTQDRSSGRASASYQHFPTHQSGPPRASDSRCGYQGTAGGQSSPIERRTCRECGKEFKRPSDANKHMSTVHATEKSFACRVCNHKFARKDYVQVRLELPIFVAQVTMGRPRIDSALNFENSLRTGF